MWVETRGSKSDTTRTDILVLAQVMLIIWCVLLVVQPTHGADIWNTSLADYVKFAYVSSKCPCVRVFETKAMVLLREVDGYGLQTTLARRFKAAMVVSVD